MEPGVCFAVGVGWEGGGGWMSEGVADEVWVGG